MAFTVPFEWFRQTLCGGLLVPFQLVAGLGQTGFAGPVERRRNVDGEILQLAGYSQHPKDYEQHKNGPEHDATPFLVSVPIVVC